MTKDKLKDTDDALGDLIATPSNLELAPDDDFSLKDAEGVVGEQICKPPILEAAPEDDFSTLRLTNGRPPSATTIRTQSVVPVTKPHTQSFFRVHPEWRMDVMALQCAADGMWYLVAPEVAGNMTQSLAKPVTLYVWIDRNGTYGIWPCGLPLDDGTDYTAWQSAHLVCQAATERWTRIAWNKSASSYDMLHLRHDVGAELPQWPEVPFAAILNTAFKGRIIREIDHPVLCRLRGEV